MCSVINENVVLGWRIVRLSELHEIYISNLNETPFPNPNYHGEKLKSKLEKKKDYQGLLGFCPIGADDQVSSYLVFNLKMDIMEAIKSSYQLVQDENIKEVADLLRNDIISRFKDVDEIP